MSPTTRSQTLARRSRRKSLRSYAGWDMFNPVTFRAVRPKPRKLYSRPQKPPQKTPQKPPQNRKPKRKVQQRKVNKRLPPASNLINNLPYDILRIIMLNLSERTLLLSCHTVCKAWADIISGLPLDVTKLGHTIHTITWSLHFDALRLKGGKCTHDRQYAEMLKRFPCLTYEKASWRRYLRNHLSD